MRRYQRTVICGLFIGILFQGCFRPPSSAADQVCFADDCIDVEVVREKEEMTRGLQFRRSLDAHSGMLFVFPQSRRQAFWMKDTLIPLDMIWLDAARRIVHIERDVPPCTKDPCPVYTPSRDAFYVLEVNAGYTAARGIIIGNQAEFRLK